MNRKNYQVFALVFMGILFATANWAGEKITDHEKNGVHRTLVQTEPSLIHLKDRRLWGNVIQPYLQDPLWITRDIYDAGHHLMVPLHAAFLLNEPEWQQDFDSHFRRFLAAYPTAMESGLKQRLNRLHYFYLVSRYLALAFSKSSTDDLKNRLYRVTLREVERLWNEDPAWQWARPPFPKGVRERILWKLATKDVPVSYHRAIIDEELFLFAIAADLLASSRLVGGAPSETLLDIVSVARRVFESEVVQTESGGWLFQPGVWADGPGHAFAGQATKTEGMKEMPLVDVAWDSSHSHRFPLWITSLANAHVMGSEGNIFYRKLKQGLTTQLVDKVLIPPGEEFPVWRVTNYMDGRNGVYRWREKDGFGYGPYELSGTFLIGWWAFLDSEKINLIYDDIASNFPLPDFVVDQFVGPNASRDRHPLILLPRQYENGFIELICRLSAKLYLQ